MKIIIKKVGENPQVMEVENNLKNLQSIVGGYIEVVLIPYENGILLVCDEEGKLKGKEANFPMGCDIICGDVFFTTANGEDFTDLNEYQINFLMEYFVKK